METAWIVGPLRQAKRIFSWILLRHTVVCKKVHKIGSVWCRMALKSILYKLFFFKNLDSYTAIFLILFVFSANIEMQWWGCWNQGQWGQLPPDFSKSITYTHFNQQGRLFPPQYYLPIGFSDLPTGLRCTSASARNG